MTHGDTIEEVREALGDSHLPPPARHIMLVLLSGFEYEREVGGPPFLPTLTVVERRTGLARSTVTQYVTALSNAGWIDRSGGVWDLMIGDPDCRRRDTIPDAVRAAVYERDNSTCQDCGATDRLTLDHIYPWSLGGSDTDDNLRVLCRPCNSRKGARV